MKSQESQADANTVTEGFKVTVLFRDAIEEFRRIYKAVQESPMTNHKDINPEMLLQAVSTEQLLEDLNISNDAELAFISALATAERESNRVSRAPGGQQRGEKLPE